MHAFVAKVGKRCFCWFPVRHVDAHLGGHQHGVSIQIPRIFPSDPNLGEGLCIFTSFHFPDSGLKLSNSFDFYFDLF